MRTMKDVKHQMQQLLVAIETRLPTTNMAASPPPTYPSPQLKIPVGPRALRLSKGQMRDHRRPAFQG